MLFCMMFSAVQNNLSLGEIMSFLLVVYRGAAGYVFVFFWYNPVGSVQIQFWICTERTHGPNKNMFQQHVIKCVT